MPKRISLRFFAYKLLLTMGTLTVVFKDNKYKKQCFGSGSAWIRIDFGRLDPDVDGGGQN